MKNDDKMIIIEIDEKVRFLGRFAIVVLSKTEWFFKKFNKIP